MRICTWTVELSNFDKSVVMLMLKRTNLRTNLRIGMGMEMEMNEGRNKDGDGDEDGGADGDENCKKWRLMKMEKEGMKLEV